MLLICNKSNKKTKRKNDKDQLILGQKYVLHNNYSGQKQGVNLILLPSKEAWIILCIVSRQFFKTYPIPRFLIANGIFAMQGCTFFSWHLIFEANVGMEMNIRKTHTHTHTHTHIVPTVQILICVYELYIPCSSRI